MGIFLLPYLTNWVRYQNDLRELTTPSLVSWCPYMGGTRRVNASRSHFYTSTDSIKTDNIMYSFIKVIRIYSLINKGVLATLIKSFELVSCSKFYRILNILAEVPEGVFRHNLFAKLKGDWRKYCNMPNVKSTGRSIRICSAVHPARLTELADLT